MRWGEPPPQHLGYARDMRRNPTPPERALWQALRRWNVDGLKFRREVPLGRYIVDFYCAERRLVVEVDGATHADPAGDGGRDAWLAGHGCAVVRVWNNEVMGNLAGVLEVIAAAARASPSPRPSPARGEGAGSSPSPLAGEGRGEGGSRPARGGGDVG